MFFTLPSFAKINLGLEVLGKRSDGFHEIFTIFQSIALHDELTFESNDDAIVLECDDVNVPLDNTNLIVRAANLLKKKFDVSAGASIKLTKRIPVGGGLGGGSSNAATALIGLAKLWEFDVSADDLQLIAAELGSDIPYFLYGGTAIGRGRGNDIESIDDISLPKMIVVTPNAHVSTKMAFDGLDAPNLTNDASNRNLNVSRLVEIRPGNLKNDFERTVFTAYPEIEEAKKMLTDLGAELALMSGSGASVFGVFDNEETRQAALKALGEHTDWRSFAVAAVSRKEYREALGL